MKLGIVGSGPDKWSAAGQARAKAAIRELIATHSPEVLVLGHSKNEVLGDWARDIANETKIPLMVFEPKTLDGNGYAARNLLIAKTADCVACVVPTKLPDGKSDDCKHCGPNNPPHVASAGCWCAWKAKAREWLILSNQT